jgi:hypothetical protein
MIDLTGLPLHLDIGTRLWLFIHGGLCFLLISDFFPFTLEQDGDPLDIRSCLNRLPT